MSAFFLSGGEITSTFDHPELVKLGHCKLIEEVMIGEDTLIHFSGVAMGTTCSLKLISFGQRTVQAKRLPKEVYLAGVNIRNKRLFVDHRY